MEFIDKNNVEKNNFIFSENLSFLNYLFHTKKINKSKKSINYKNQKSTIPSSKTIKKACQLSNSLNKPIKLNYYIDSLKKTICIASCIKDKIIFKNNDEYTTPIKNTFKVNSEYLVVTENTIYIISDKIPIK